MRTLQEKGLIDPEAFEQDWNTYISKGSENILRCLLHMGYGQCHWYERYLRTSYQSWQDLMEPSDTRTNGMGFRAIGWSSHQLIKTLSWPLSGLMHNTSQFNLYKITGVHMVMRPNRTSFEYDEATNSLKHLPLNGTFQVNFVRRQKSAVHWRFWWVLMNCNHARRC